MLYYGEKGAICMLDNQGTNKIYSHSTCQLLLYILVIPSYRIKKVC